MPTAEPNAGPHARPDPGPAPLPAGRTVVAGALVTVLAGAALTLVGGLASGAPAAYGAAIASGLVLGFFGLGGVALVFVMKAMPQAALAAALLTYTLQVVALGGAAALLRRSGLLDGAVDPQWLGGSVIVLTLAWLSAATVTGLRARIPLYDLPVTSVSRPPGEPKAGAR